MVKLAQPTPVSETETRENIAWAALEKVAQKQKCCDRLPEGTQHSVNLRIEGEVDGQPFERQIMSLLSIGHGQTRSSSVNPQVPELIAWILGKLNRATRNRILMDVPEDFAANDNCIPESSEVLVSEVEHMLQRLRKTKTVDARGSVRCEYSL